MSQSVQESKMSFSVYVDDEQEDMTEEDMNEERLHKKDKKRRLTSDQVNFLEDSFEKESKLEPERKLFIAKHLGLQPRQVAVWFQNRRAGWKTKQLEHDYDSMKARYLALLKDNEMLQVEVAALTDLLERKKGVSETGDFSLLNEQGNTSLVLSPTAAHPSIQEQSVEKAKDLYLKYDGQSPTKSGESEELDSDIYVPPSEASLLRMVTGAVPGLFSDGLLEGIYNPTFLQQVVVKLEENVFQAENCGSILSLEELGLFPLYD